MRAETRCLLPLAEAPGTLSVLIMHLADHQVLFFHLQMVTEKDEIKYYLN